MGHPGAAGTVRPGCAGVLRPGRGAGVPLSTGALVQLTGPIGSGKSTTADAWHRRRMSVGRPGAVFDWDAIHNTLAAGDEVRGLEPVDVDTSYRFAARVVALRASRAIAAGTDCIVVGARLAEPPAAWADVWTDLEALDPFVVCLLPDLATGEARSAGDPTRAAEWRAAEAVRASHELDWAAWDRHPSGLVIDTSALSVDEVVDRVELAIEGSRTLDGT